MSEKAPVPAAKRSDWKTLPMPARHSTFTIRRSFTEEEFACLQRGFLPREMEDKWFAFYENGTLYAHRSWTGFCIYELAFALNSNSIAVTVNRDPAQYKCADDKTDIAQIHALLNWWSGLPGGARPEMEEALESLGKTQHAVLHDVLLANGKERGAVYFHRPEEPNGFLSNWYPSTFKLDGVQYSSAEQYLMQQKCLLFGDQNTARRVMATDDPEKQQALGRQAAGFDQAIWTGMRQMILLRALQGKFSQNESLKAALADTGSDLLVECAGSDKVWACGVSLQSDSRKDMAKWNGLNLLGFALMEVRAQLCPKPPRGITIVQGDITKLECDCIVNAANTSLLGGGGVDGAIHRAAGPELLRECMSLHGCGVGEAKITKGYRLPAARIIHTVGPRYSGLPQDAVLLANCYRNSLELAKQNGIHSIAFPAISTGVYGYPLEEATEVAVATVNAWLAANESWPMLVIFCCFDDMTRTVYQFITDKL